MNREPVRQTSDRRLTRRHFVQLTGAGLGSAVLLNACGGGDDKASSTPPASGSATAPTSAVKIGGELRYGGSRDVTTLDPHLGTLSEEVTAFSGLYPSSLSYSDDSQIIPSLAEKFEYPDNTTLVMTYRTDVTFHDGTPFNADAVKKNFDRYLDPVTGTSGGAALTKKIAAVEVLDAKTVRFRLVSPDATALASIGGVRMISPVAIDKYGKDLARNVAGAGPYKLKEWQKDDHLTMERFEAYWDTKKAAPRVPRLDSFTFRPIVEPSVMIANLKTRNIDVAAAIQPVDFDTVKSASGVVAVERQPSSSVRMYINVNRGPTNDLRVRQAISMAIDRAAIGKAVYFGLGQPAASVFSPTNWMYPKDRAIPKQDVAGAKAKLSAAGNANITLDMVLPAAEPYRSIAQVIQASMAQAGITVNIKQLESSQFLEALKAHEGHLALDAIGNRSDPDGFVSGNYKATSSFNFAGFNDARFEKALADALLLTDQKERGKLYQAAEQRLLDEVPTVFLYNPPGLYAQLDTVQEFRVVDFVGGVYDTTWLKKS
ncbi:MAG: ABC transporter substrate-binding protein [Tepidiformaceae bacterium]